MSRPANYQEAMKAMQAGVGLQLGIYERATSEGNHALAEEVSSEFKPKHLRVGVNSALIDSGALFALLVRKGLVTDDEVHGVLYETAMRDVATYEERLSTWTNAKVELGYDSGFDRGTVRLTPKPPSGAS